MSATALCIDINSSTCLQDKDGQKIPFQDGVCMIDPTISVHFHQRGHGHLY